MDERKLRRWNGSDRNIGWYMCVPMTVIAETFGMNLTELGEQTWYWKGEKMSEPHHGNFPIEYYTCEAWIAITESVNA